MNTSPTSESNVIQYDLAGTIIGIAMKIHSELGYGFLENVYHRCLCIELENAKIPFEFEKRINVFYKNRQVGYYDADLVVNKNLIIEIKAIQNLIVAHEVQLVHYLAATNINEGLLLNFGSGKLEFKKKFRTKKVKEFIL
jgi:GxxExxY protein